MNYRRTKYTVIFYNDPDDKRELSGLSKEEAEEYAKSLEPDFKIIKVIK